MSDADFELFGPDPTQCDMLGNQFNSTDIFDTSPGQLSLPGETAASLDLGFDINQFVDFDSNFASTFDSTFDSSFDSTFDSTFDSISSSNFDTNFDLSAIAQFNAKPASQGTLDPIESLLATPPSSSSIQRVGWASPSDLTPPASPPKVNAPLQSTNMSSVSDKPVIGTPRNFEEMLLKYTVHKPEDFVSPELADSPAYSSSYATATTDSQRVHVHNTLTGKCVCLNNGTYAYAKGYYPAEPLGDYKYAPAKGPVNAFDHTSYHPAHDLSTNSEVNLPLPTAFIDEARLPLSIPDAPVPPQLFDQNGQPDWTPSGQAMRKIDILPRYISTAVEGWRLHYWLVMDPRIRWSDIVGRMAYRCTNEGGEGPLAGGTAEIVRTLKKRLDKFRMEHGILSPCPDFDEDGYEVTAADIKAISKLNLTQLEYGVCWLIDEDNGVMMPPKLMDLNNESNGHQFLLPVKKGISLRVQKILDHINKSKINRQGPKTPPQAQRSSPKTKISPQLRYTLQKQGIELDSSGNVVPSPQLKIQPLPSTQNFSSPAVPHPAQIQVQGQQNQYMSVSQGYAPESQFYPLPQAQLQVPQGLYGPAPQGYAPASQFLSPPSQIQTPAQSHAQLPQTPKTTPSRKRTASKPPSSAPKQPKTSRKRAANSTPQYNGSPAKRARKAPDPAVAAVAQLQGPVQHIWNSPKAQGQGAQRERPMQELLDDFFFNLTQEEKARLLLPILQGQDPIEADKLRKQGQAQAQSYILQAKLQAETSPAGYGAARQREAINKAVARAQSGTRR